MCTWVVIGTLFYSGNENWSLIDGFYWTVCTMTTVGYGDLFVRKHTTLIFGIFFIFASSLTFAFAFNNWVEDYAIEKRRAKVSDLLLFHACIIFIIFHCDVVRISYSCASNWARGSGMAGSIEPCAAAPGSVTRRRRLARCERPAVAGTGSCCWCCRSWACWTPPMWGRSPR